MNLTTKYKVSTAKPPLAAPKAPGDAPLCGDLRKWEGPATARNPHDRKRHTASQGKKRPGQAGVPLFLGRQGWPASRLGRAPDTAPTGTGSSPEGVCQGLTESQSRDL